MARISDVHKSKIELKRSNRKKIQLYSIFRVIEFGMLAVLLFYYLKNSGVI